MQNHNKKSIPRFIEQQPQTKVVRKREIVCMDAWGYQLFANAREMRGH